MYTVLSREKTYHKRFCIDEFKNSVIKSNKDALME